MNEKPERGDPVRIPAATYGLALAALLVVVLARWLLDPFLGDTFPLVTLYGAIAAAVWFGGYRPALIVTALGYLACAYLFIPPRGTLGWSQRENLVGLIAYLITCSIIIAFGETARLARRSATARQRQAEHAEESLCRSVEQLHIITESMAV